MNKKTLFLSIFIFLMLSAFAQEQEIKTIAGILKFQVENDCQVSTSHTDIVLSGVEQLVLEYDLLDGHPIRVSAPLDDQVMMLGSGNSGKMIQGFFSRLTNSAIIFEAEKVTVECLTNNVKNSGSGKYQITLISSQKKCVFVS